MDQYNRTEALTVNNLMADIPAAKRFNHLHIYETVDFRD